MKIIKLSFINNNGLMLKAIPKLKRIIINTVLLTVINIINYALFFIYFYLADFIKRELNFFLKLILICF